MINVLFTKLSDHALIPKKATAGAACFDLHAAENVWIKATDQAGIKTGLAVAIPAGYCMNIYSRSGHGLKDRVSLSNCVGKIDSDYRGEIVVVLKNDHWVKTFEVRIGDRIAQAEIVPVEDVCFIEVPVLDATQRGAGCFGSTGVKELVHGEAASVLHDDQVVVIDLLTTMAPLLDEINENDGHANND